MFCRQSAVKGGLRKEISLVSIRPASRRVSILTFYPEFLAVCAIFLPELKPGAKSEISGGHIEAQALILKKAELIKPLLFRVLSDTELLVFGYPESRHSGFSPFFLLQDFKDLKRTERQAVFLRYV